MREASSILGTLFFLGGAVGCATPLIHPLRATNGWVGEVATSIEITAGKQGSCYEGCQDRVVGTPAVNPAEGSIGYSHVAGGWFGAMAGIYMPAFENQKSNYGVGAVWTYFTAQNDLIAAGVGPEVGPGGVAILSGLEVQPIGTQKKWTPAIGVYGRWFFPFEPTNEPFDARVPVSEYGFRGRYGPYFVEYTFYRPTKSLLSYAYPIEGGYYTEAHHIFTVGMTFDAISKRAF